MMSSANMPAMSTSRFVVFLCYMYTYLHVYDLKKYFYEYMLICAMTFHVKYAAICTFLCVKFLCNTCIYVDMCMYVYVYVYIYIHIHV